MLQTTKKSMQKKFGWREKSHKEDPHQPSKARELQKFSPLKTLF